VAIRWQPFNWYHDVEYYDIVFDQTTDQEVAFMEGIAGRHGTSGRRVLEPGCGSGRLVAAMARRGWSVTGFDIEPRALEYARTRILPLEHDMQRQRSRAASRAGPGSRPGIPPETRPGARSGARSARPMAELGSVRLCNARFDDFRVPAASFDLAHCLYSTLLHATAPGEAERHLRLVTDALRVGGLYVLGLHLTDYRRTEVIRERADCRRGSTRVIYTLRHGLPDRRLRIQPMRCRLTVREGASDRKRLGGTSRHQRDTSISRTRNGRAKSISDSPRRLESNWNFRTYDDRELGTLLRSEPRLRLIATHDFHHDLQALNEGRDATFDRVLVLRREER